MKKWIIILILAVIGGGFFLLKGRDEKNGANEQERFAPAQVETRTLRRFVESTGEVRPDNRLGVTSPISGRIEELLVEEGDTVSKGDIIAWVSSTERATLLDTARAKGEDAVAYWEDIYKAAPLIAPLSGTIIARNFEPGQTINSSSAIVVIADKLILVGQVDETDIGTVIVGQTVEIRLDAYPDTLFMGTVTAIAYDSKMVSNVTMYEVDVIPIDLPDVARSGMTATLTFVAETHENVLTVPTAALKYENGQAFVQTSPEKKVAVKTGLSENSFTEISGDLQAGDAILIPQIVRKKDGGTSPFMPNRKKK
jgi:macrolide-specific efflux system membrane fusion protein